MNIQLNKFFDFRKRISYLIGLEIGTYSLKVVGLKVRARPSLAFYSVIELPEKHNGSYVADAVKKVLKENGVSVKDTVLTFSDEAVAFRREEIPALPNSEIVGALRWQEKDTIPFNTENAYIGFKLLEEIHKEDGSKVIDVIFAAAAKEAMDNKVETARAANLSVMSVNMVPFGLENILKTDQETYKDKAVVVVDLGFKKTEISIYRNNALQFVRYIPLGSHNITEAMQGTLSSDDGDIQLSMERAEEIKKQLGIAYEEVTLEKGISSTQILSLMRPILEQLLKEIRRSIDYYIQEYGKKDEPVGVCLIGGGALLKNLDKYLSEELNLPIKLMSIPKSIDTSRVNFKPEDTPLIVGLIGIVLGYRDNINLLPHTYETEKIESLSRVMVNIVSMVVCLVLAGSFLFIRSQINDYKNKLKRLPFAANTLASVRDLQTKIVEREVFLAKIKESDVNMEHLMKVLSNIIPQNVVLEGLSLNPKTKTLDMRGIFYGPKNDAEKILTKFTEDLEKAKEFKDAQLSSLQSQAQAAKEGETSHFEITSSLE